MTCTTIMIAAVLVFQRCITPETSPQVSIEYDYGGEGPWRNVPLVIVCGDGREVRFPQECPK